MMFKACSTIAERQMSLSQAKIQLEVQESMARERIKSVVKCVEQLARYGTIVILFSLPFVKKPQQH